MGLFNESVNEMAYLKGSVLGFPGSGKTLSASLLALGLRQFVKSKKPVYFLDTERGAKFVKSYFDRAQIPLRVARSRAFVDLLAAVREAEKEGEILIIDSISHFWSELIEAYKTKRGKKSLTLRDWGQIKPEWAQFTELYLNSKLHILMLGRAGWDFEEVEDEEGIQKLVKAGTKMKVETDLGYEPFLTLEMEKVRKKTGKIGSAFEYRCWVLKDKANLIMGAFMDFKAAPADKLDLTENNPVFQFVLPHIRALNLGGEHAGTAQNSSTGMFDTNFSAAEYSKKMNIALEELENELRLKFSGADSETKKKKIEALKDLFGTSSWTAIQTMALEKIQAAVALVKEKFHREAV